MNFEQSEISRIQDIHFQLSGCTTGKSLYESALLSINSLLKADHALFFAINEERRPISYSAFGFDTIENIDPMIVQQYYQKFYKLDPLFNHLLELSGGATHHLLSPLEIMSDEKFHKEAFYKSFIKPYFDNIGTLDHMLLLMLCDNGLPVAIYIFFRVKNKGPFGDKDKQFLELLVSPLITNIRRIAVEESVRERDLIISRLSVAEFPTGDTEYIDTDGGNFGLTDREIEVSEQVMTGMPNGLIADQLGVSVRTVENHLRSIYKKLNIHNRTTLASIMSS
jgi:DNA-binding CsgD family transcriptional regulator